MRNFWARHLETMEAAACAVVAILAALVWLAIAAGAGLVGVGVGWLV